MSDIAEIPVDEQERPLPPPPRPVRSALTDGPILRTLLGLAWPNVVALSAGTGTNWPLLLVPVSGGLQVWRHGDKWEQAQFIERAVDTQVHPSIRNPGYSRSFDLSLCVDDVNGDPFALTGLPAAQHRGRYGGYINFQQQVTSNATLFLNAVMADERTARVDRQIAAGLIYTGPFSTRPDDDVAFARQASADVHLFRTLRYDATIQQALNNPRNETRCSTNREGPNSEPH